jgi:hypothetical protein
MDTTETNVDAEESPIFQKADQDGEIELEDATALLEVQSIGRATELYAVEPDQEIEIISPQPTSIRLLGLGEKQN